MGATPEVLLKSEGKKLETVSLAGTQSRRTDDNYSWHTKDIEEQAFVSRYLLDVFYRFNISPYTTHGPETLESGRVAHLSTSFRFLPKSWHQTWVISLLSCTLPLLYVATPKQKRHIIFPQ
jgi:isochorismate synthase